MPSSSIRQTLHLTRMAADGLRRKKGRSALTMLGVFIGVFALTLIIALGNGLESVLTDTVAGESNLRQIAVSAGFGTDTTREPEEVTIAGDMSDMRRARLRRAAVSRVRPGPRIGRRPKPMTQAVLDGMAKMEHVTSVQPIMLERYAVACGEHNTSATLTLGVDTAHRRFAERVVAGGYFTGQDSQDVLIHEYLAYQWGFVTEAQSASLVGKTVTLTMIGGNDSLPGGFDVAAMLGSMEGLTDEEKRALPGLAKKVGDALRGGGGDGKSAAPAPALQSFTFRIAGVYREMEAGDAFNVIEDGSTFQVDLLLPDGTARKMFEAAAMNRELGFPRALVTVDDSANAATVELALRTKGFTAFSVSSVLTSAEGTLTAVTVIISFLTGIALLVAALGILNTMVTSVLERTREIGLWKAVGATDGQIRAVFVLEAAMIGLLGSALGLGIALILMIPGDALAHEIIQREATVPLAGSVFRAPVWLMFLGPGIAVAVSVLAALYPAWRASRVDPVKALRHE